MLHQRRYAKETLKRFEMEECNTTSTLVETRLHLTKDPYEYEVDPTKYRRYIRSLRYLCHVRPDLTYCVCMVSRLMQKSNISHLVVTKGILRCLRGTLDYGILFHALNEGK